MQWEAINQTLNYLLRGGFKDHKELTGQMQRLRQKCPELFRSYIFQADDVNDDDDEGGMEGQAEADADHRNISYLGAIKPTIAQASGLPTKENNANSGFINQLVAAYNNNYGQQMVLMGSGRFIKWWKKVSFESSR